MMRVVVRDDDVDGPGRVGLQGVAARGGGVAHVDVAPQVPHPARGVRLERRHLPVVLVGEDVREAQAHEGDAAPRADVLGHRLAEHLGQGVRRLGMGVVVLVDRCVARGSVGAEGEAQRRLARGPDDLAKSQRLGGQEDVRVHRGVLGEGARCGTQPRGGDVGQVHDGVGSVEDVDDLSVVGEVSPEVCRVDPVRGWREVGREDAVAVLQQVGHGGSAGFAGGAGHDDVRRCGRHASTLAARAPGPRQDRSADSAKGKAVGLPLRSDPDLHGPSGSQCDRVGENI